MAWRHAMFDEPNIIQKELRIYIEPIRTSLQNYTCRMKVLYHKNLKYRLIILVLGRTFSFPEKNEVISYGIWVHDIILFGFSRRIYNLIKCNWCIKILRQRPRKNLTGSWHHGVAKAVMMDSSIYRTVWLLIDMVISMQPILEIIV